MPALHMRMSRRGEENFWAAALTEARDARSHSRKVMLAEGTEALMVSMRDAAVWGLRPLK